MIATVTSGGAAVVTDQPGTADEIPQERPTENVTQRLALDFYEGSSDPAILLFVAYPARNEAEAEAARAQTLDPDWYQPRDWMEAIFDRRSDGDETLRDGLVTVGYSERSMSLTPREPEHGWVRLHYDTGWENFAEQGEAIRIGQTFVDELGPEWRIKVTYPTSWDPSTMNGDPHTGSDGPQGISQTWNLSDDPETPLIVFGASEVESEEEDSIPLGPAGGIGPAALALIIVVVGATARQLRSS